ncbi:hypothetical protein BDN72DRAFT_635201 [Pluteus cervinus]|uniref:Uncharacterized protein n=1 Tax=Pluteus cervinus TaxID=181527 RepID=A0ACD3B9R0_9AGAR|nr:hypothetical protein BDN72DRAFT_635201 [Pluteus cervinus]
MYVWVYTGKGNANAFVGGTSRRYFVKISHISIASEQEKWPLESELTLVLCFGAFVADCWIMPEIGASLLPSLVVRWSETAHHCTCYRLRPSHSLVGRSHQCFDRKVSLTRLLMAGLPSPIDSQRCRMPMPFTSWVKVLFSDLARTKNPSLAIRVQHDYPTWAVRLAARASQPSSDVSNLI